MITAPEFVTTLDTSRRLHNNHNLNQDSYFKWRKAGKTSAWILRSAEWFKSNPTATSYELHAAYTIAEFSKMFEFNVDLKGSFQGITAWRNDVNTSFTNENGAEAAGLFYEWLLLNEAKG